VAVVDWNAYSQNRPDWFGADGLHLANGGASAMATLVHGELDRLGLVAAPPSAPLAIVTRALPTARLGRPYRTRVTAVGGTRPITWARIGGAVPVGLRLLADGTLSGTPRAVGRQAPILRATDARGRSVSRALAIVVAPG